VQGEEQNEGRMSTENPYAQPEITGRARLKRTLFWICLAFAALLVAFFISAWPYIKAAKVQRDWNNYVASNRQAEYDRKAADKVGSSTPEGTFYEYVTALKRGDLEGAAAYFVPENRAQHLEDLKKENMPDLILYLKKLEVALATSSRKWECSNDQIYCGIISQYKLDFQKYPSGNWKIEDY
jgi:hypothetical protein